MIRTVLLPLDHSEFAENAIAPAAAIARKLNAHVDVVLVQQDPALANIRKSGWNDDQLREDECYVQDIAQRLGRHGLAECSHAVLTGEVVQAICVRAAEVGVDLIVLTSHGQTGFSRAHLGSVAYGLVRQSSLPVLVLRDPDIAQPAQTTSSMFRKILVPLDGSPASLTVLASATELARSTGASIVLLRVVEPVPVFAANVWRSRGSRAPGALRFLWPSIQDTRATENRSARARKQLGDVMSMLTDEALVAVESAVVVGSPVAAEIVHYATAIGADLIAISTHGRGASRWLLGSVADAVFRTSTVPLLLARPAQVDAKAPVSLAQSNYEVSPALSGVS